MLSKHDRSGTLANEEIERFTFEEEATLTSLPLYNKAILKLLWY
jgi:hypothetical protein